MVTNFLSLLPWKSSIWVKIILKPFQQGALPTYNPWKSFSSTRIIFRNYTQEHLLDWRIWRRCFWTTICFGIWTRKRLSPCCTWRNCEFMIVNRSQFSRRGVTEIGKGKPGSSTYLLFMFLKKTVARMGSMLWPRVRLWTAQCPDSSGFSIIVKSIKHTDFFSLQTAGQ